MKNIAKELLFSGCERDIRNDDGNTAMDLFDQNKHLFNDQEIKKISYILTKPKSCSCLRLTRPIERVNRNRITQCIAIFFDLFTLLCFVVAASYS